MRYLDNIIKKSSTKIKFDILIVHGILLYPLLLSMFVIFGVTPFFITAPYFFLILLLLLLGKKLTLKIKGLSFLAGLLFIIAIFNFSSIRYSSPLLFSFYTFALLHLMNEFDEAKSNQSLRIFNYYFIIYLSFGILFLLSPHAYMLANNRYLGFPGSGTLFSSIISVFYIIYFLSHKNKLGRIILFVLSFYLIFLTETRLTLMFLLLFPALNWFINYKVISRTFIFWVYYSLLFFLYPAYQVLILYFPYIVTFRYEEGRDASFGLRYILYEHIYTSFINQDFIKKVFGSGNEFARTLIIEKTDLDLFPHNDFMRIILDWGIMGFIIFSFLVYKLSIKNKYVLYTVLMYALMFYSNMIFNLFFISLIVVLYKLNITDFKKNQYGHK